MKRITFAILALFIFISLLAGCGGGGGGGGDGRSTYAGPPIIWAAKAPMHTPRTEFGVATVNDKLYAIGGYSGSTLHTVEEYDPATNTWTTKADMPTARALLVVTAVNNKIYAIGGMNYTNPNYVTYINSTEEYDPATNTWIRKADIPIPPAFNSVLGNLFIGGAAANGKIYVVVFNTQILGTTATYEYDPVSDTWTTKSPVPAGGVGTPYAVAALNNKIYVLASSNLTEYDPLSDMWIIKTSLPGNRSLAGLVGVPSKNKLYAVGGMDASGNVLGSIEEYDPSSNVWTTRAPMPTPRYLLGSGEVGGRIYIIGGSDSPDRFYPYPHVDVEEGR